MKQKRFNKFLDKDAENHYQSAKELAVDLRRLAQKTTTEATAVPRRAPEVAVANLRNH